MIALRGAGEIMDPREARIARLKAENAELRERVATRDARITKLMEFETLAVSRLAAQHAGIERLRRALARPENIMTLPVGARINARQLPPGGG